MLSGVTTICFASCYAIALLLEALRLVFRRGLGLGITLTVTAAGLVAHVAFLYHRAARAVGSPLSSEKDWYLLAALAMVLVYVCLAVVRPKVPWGLFLLPLALGLIGAATYLAPETLMNREPSAELWGSIHSISILLATVSVLIGFVAGLMYLGQVRHLKAKRPLTGRLRLPSLEWLQRTNSRAIILATVTLGAGIISGMALNQTNVNREAGPVPWNDPVILTTCIMFCWLLAAVVIIAFYRPVRQGRKVAYLTLASFVFLAVVLGTGLLMQSRHWGRDQREQRREERGERIPALGGTGWSAAKDVAGSSTRPTQFGIQLSAFDILPLSPLTSPPSLHRGGRPC